MSSVKKWTPRESALSGSALCKDSNKNGERVLIIGATGLLGPYLMRAFQGRAIGAARSGTDVDLDCRDAGLIAEVLECIRPSKVVLAAAMTNVDECEREPEKAFTVNGDSVEKLIKYLRPDVHLVYLSTDQVYPDVSGPHRENGEGPINIYGKSKLKGEFNARKHPSALILRINIFGPSMVPHRRSLSDFVIEALAGGKRICLFEDVFFSPLHMETMSSYIARMADLGITGVYNLGSRNGMSKKDFALAIADHKGLQTRTTSPAKSSEIAGRVPRPSDLRMDISRIELALGEKMPTLEEEIAKL